MIITSTSSLQSFSLCGCFLFCFLPFFRPPLISLYRRSTYWNLSSAFYRNYFILSKMRFRRSSLNFGVNSFSSLYLLFLCSNSNEKISGASPPSWRLIVLSDAGMRTHKARMVAKQSYSCKLCCNIRHNYVWYEYGG